MPSGSLNRSDCNPFDSDGLTRPVGDDCAPQWHVLWSKSNCERTIHAQLVEKGYEVFLPTVHKWSRNKRVQRLYRAPLFPGYLFVRHAIDRFSYLDISKARGLVQILGDRWDRLAAVEDREIEALMKLQEADIPRMPYSYLREGEPVRIISGPLTNVEGIFVKPDSERGLLVLSVALLSRSVAVHVERSQVVPV